MPRKILLRKTSLVDFPGRVSSVFFFPGCNLRCPWCHNRELLSDQAEGLVALDEALAFLRKRCSVLGAVVLSGGEPCLWENLPGLIEETKRITPPHDNKGLLVKLDTNGMFPAMLEKLFRREETRPDYIALDLKLAPSRYRELWADNPGSHNDPGENLSKSTALIQESGIAHEYRTLVLPGGFITENDIEALAPLVKGPLGTNDAPWFFRPFRGGNCLDPSWNSLEEPAREAHDRAETLAKKARELGKNAIVPYTKDDALKKS